MNRKLLVMSVTAAVLAAGATSATTMHKKHSMSEGGHYAAPSQPIPYAQLDAYLTGSRSERQQIEAQGASKDAQTAQNGMSNPATANQGMMSDTAAAPTGAAPMTSDGPTDNTGSANTPESSAPQGGSNDVSSPGMNGSAGTPQTDTVNPPSASPNSPQQ